MPNWVYSGLAVTGPKEEVDRFLEQAGRPYEVRFPEFPSGEPKTTLHEEEFSFWNFVRPADDALDAYFGQSGFGDGVSQGWYAWNINHWGTKWDASDVSVERFADDHALVRFSTAWSPPEEAILAASSQFPALVLTLEWEEEQGFGAETEFHAGTSLAIRSWDIPASHADHEERDRECVCSYEDDQEYWFSDCPRPGPDGEDFVEDLSEMIG